MPRSIPTTIADREALTLGEASAVFKEDLEELSRLFKIGTIPAQWRGRQWVVLRSHMREYVARKAEEEARGRKPRVKAFG